MADAPRPPTEPGRAVVFFHAHPDDEAIFTGGTMALLAGAGWRVVLVVATGGEQGEMSAGGEPRVPPGVRRVGEDGPGARRLGGPSGGGPCCPGVRVQRAA